jgi:glycosyltransferase involved in cell wall biosynthesis
MRAGAIVHFTESLATGVLAVVRELASDSAARGIPTTVVHGRRPQTPDDVAALFHPGVRLVEVPGFGSRSLRGVLAVARAGTVLRKELARAGGGVLHIHSTFAGVIGRLVAPRQGWRTFYTPQGYAFLNPAHPRVIRGAARTLERRLGLRATTLASSETEAGVARDDLGLRRVQTVQNGVAVGDQWQRQAPPADGVARVVSVGRAAPQRRPELFAEIAARFRSRGDVRFVWVGDGALRPELERAGVNVTGWVIPAVVAEHLADAQVVLHLATFEGLPLALLEAMRGGRAIVASDLPVLREVGEGVVEFVVDADSGEIAIDRLLADPDRRAGLGAAASARVRERYSAEAMTRAAYRAYGLEESG